MDKLRIIDILKLKIGIMGKDFRLYILLLILLFLLLGYYNLYYN